MKYDKITLHISDSRGGSAKDIRKWHVDEKGWSDIGYHHIILNGRIKVSGTTYDEFLDGAIQTGRPESKYGAHVLNNNKGNLGICLIAAKAPEGGKATDKQMATALKLVYQKCSQYGIPIDKVYGHYELDPERRQFCPCFNMDDFRDSLKAIDLSIGV